MKRAAILIGVDKTGNLPVLNDAAKGAQEMAAWARNQQFDEVHVFTDEQRPVDAGPIGRKVRELVESRTLEQLIVYFAGHGVNLRYSEFWLLSDAPINPQAAVNVQGSVTLARQCGIPHVVFFSDACRTAADGIQAQQVTGSEIFPNDPVGGPEKPVDIFFATILGKPAQEVRDPAESAAAFKALYTGVLKEALEGSRAEIVDRSVAANESVGLVRPRPLRDFLGPALGQRLKQLNLHLRVHQSPDARITSDPDAWISRVPLSAIPATPVTSPAPPASPTRAGAGPQAAPEQENLHTVSTELLDSALRDDRASIDATLAGAVSIPAVDLDALDAGELVRGAAHDASPFGPTHFETGCGLKLRGTYAVRAVSAHAKCELISPGELVRVDQVEGPAAVVLLVLPDDTSVAIPAIPGFLAGLTFEQGQLANVAYEPSDNSGRWPEYEHRLREIRTLRGVVAASARMGVFRLEEPNALEFARRMQYSKSLDPSLALYAAYAYDVLQRRRFIENMNVYLQADLGMTFFDIAMLAHELDKKQLTPDPCFSPSVPLLGQGWALLGAHQIRLTGALQGIEHHLLSSLWTQFTPQGTQIFEQAILNEEVW